ncbi:plasmid replication initiator RepA [Candidatus Erwinia dacicola]|uniref:IncFII family plasmid replication initiator RepA n=1 Tax=Candidatus Erwinia dacicola TaxID=252393 RepID=A0A1E7Z3X1_9GAMM|nr:plasmid replication initiator RepA [Candidatus Erwinia dacicola]OFC63335.1 incFII family plasmid replication initiator RepA [Candidatus Erwinia dacicola]
MTSRNVSLTNNYIQVKNPTPLFVKPKDKGTLPFCLKLMEKAQGFTDRFDFLVHVAFSRSIGKRHRKPPVLRCRVIDVLLQAMCFHYDPLAGETGRVQRSVTNLAIECGLATESDNGNLSITRVTRALESLANDFGLIRYDSEFDPVIGCNVPSDIEFTPALFEALDISPEALTAARNSRAEWENQRREKKGLPRLDIMELAANAFRYVRDGFRKYHKERREQGLKRARAKRESILSRKEIEAKVKREVSLEIAAGRFPVDMAAARREIARRTTERTILSRGNYTRLSSPA